MAIANKNILVTGGAGFVGSHLLERFDASNNIIVLDNFRYGDLKNIAHTQQTVIEGDLRHIDLVELMHEHDIDLVFHLAAFHLDDSLNDPMTDFETTALGGIRVLEACRQHPVERLVFSSTGSVYGQPQHMHHGEDHPLVPTTPYGVSKTCMDHYCRIYQDLYDVQTVRLRYYNIYGPRRTAGAIPKFILQALRGETITINGGEQTRTPTYVGDIADATYRAGHLAGIEGQAFNISAHENISIMELAKLIVKLCGTEEQVTFEMTDFRPGEIIHLRPDVTTARDVLGWSAKVTMADGLEQLIDYLRKQIS